MPFYHNCHFRRKNKINKSKNNFHKQSPSAPSADITNLNQVCKRTVLLIEVLRPAAYNYYRALKPCNIASTLLAKAWRSSEEHVRRWIELLITIVINPLQIEMAIICHELDDANSAALFSTGEGLH
jgi:hypothetical protein